MFMLLEFDSTLSINESPRKKSVAIQTWSKMVDSLPYDNKNFKF